MKIYNFFSHQMFPAILIKGDKIDQVDWTGSSVIPLVADAVAYYI